MYSTGLIITLIIGGLTATVASSNDDILCYLQNLEDKLNKLEDKMESKLDSLQKQSCSATKDDGKTDHDTSDDGKTDHDSSDDGKTDHDSSDDGKTDHDSSDGNVVRAKRIRDPFTLGNTPKKTITGLDVGLWGMYIADDGIAYITGDNIIAKLDSNGNKLKEITVDKGATGIHVKGNKVFVASGDEIEIFTRDLTKVGKIRPELICHPRAVAVDSDDKIYIAGSGNAICVYNQDGSKSHKIDLKEPGINYYIRFDANEILYTANINGNAVSSYTKAGAFLRKFSLNGIAGGLFVDDNGNIYVLGGFNSQGLIYILNSSGSIIKRFQTPVEKTAPFGNEVFIAPDGTLWVLNAFTRTIYLY